MQLLETFLALGELTNWRRLGLLMYPQRHGFCSLSFPQHTCDGGEDDVIAAAHGASSVGEHVTPSATGILATATRRIAAMRAKTETHITFAIFFFFKYLYVFVCICGCFQCMSIVSIPSIYREGKV